MPLARDYGLDVAFRAAFGRTRAQIEADERLRRALMAENLGKPSLWVIIAAPWYNDDQIYHR